MVPRLVWLVVVVVVVAVLVVGLSHLAAPASTEPDAAAYLYSLIEREGKLDLPEEPFNRSMVRPSLPMGPKERLLRTILLGPEIAHCTLFAEGVRGKKLLRPRLECQDAFGQLHSSVRADEGELDVAGDRPTLVLHFTDGEIVYAADGRRGDFEDKTWSIPLSTPCRAQ